MRVKIEFVQGPEPQIVVFTNVTKINTIDMLGYTRTVIFCGDEKKYSTPTYLIHKLEVEEDETN